jgi:Zn finger protein HypA/HybF involved in hydrogenase expression
MGAPRLAQSRINACLVSDVDIAVVAADFSRDFLAAIAVEIEDGNLDPHAAALGADCTSCHSPASWDARGRDARFDHTLDTRFALDALHARLECAACHEGLRFEALGRACADCHTDAVAFLSGDALGAHVAADPHASEIECRDCHPASVVKPSLIEYERACLTCHPAPYASLLATKKRLVDESVVKVESVLFARALARRLGDSPASPSGESAATAAVAVITRSGLHHAALSEAVLLELLESLRATEASE